MEKQTSRRGEPKKVLETSLLQMNHNDCFGLIGGIVEKVARHRSHGPHWRPMSSKGGDDDNDDSDSNVEDDEDDKAFMESDPVAAFANPVRRRRKKELEFRKWKEIIMDDSSSRNSKEDTFYSRKTKGKTKGEASKIADKRTSLSADKSTSASMKVDAKLQSKNLDGGFIDSVTAMEIDNSSQLDLQEKVKDRPDFLRRPEQNKLTSSSMEYCSNSSNFRNEQESMTLENQIDAENQSRIEQMSAEEISEAQAEIMEKLDPTLLKLLQKRGQEKLNKKNQSISEVSNGCRFVDQQVENTKMQNIHCIQRMISPLQ
ncbi:hypothetical protein L6164_037682 [Bauhinia variegata]|uniref:Uncharacterized protein n=1 Tax=Bauhinia variegata TaxID=167791 RepID=A0ACB9KKX0_BAUVA|nr:hypothetical protein L6164_037682 [Bauhinia variegata]